MSAGDLTGQDYATAEAFAWRLVMACVRGPADPRDGISLWRLTVDHEIGCAYEPDTLDAVLEVLAQSIADRMVLDHGGREGAAGQVAANIAAALDRAEGGKHLPDD